MNSRLLHCQLQFHQKRLMPVLRALDHTKGTTGYVARQITIMIRTIHINFWNPNKLKKHLCFALQTMQLNLSDQLFAQTVKHTKTTILEFFTVSTKVTELEFLPNIVDICLCVSIMLSWNVSICCKKLYTYERSRKYCSTNVYTSSYIRHHTVQCRQSQSSSHSVAAHSPVHSLAERIN